MAIRSNMKKEQPDTVTGLFFPYKLILNRIRFFLFFRFFRFGCLQSFGAHIITKVGTLIISHVLHSLRHIIVMVCHQVRQTMSSRMIRREYID